MKVPVRLNGGDGRIVVVEVRVCCSTQIGWNSVTEEKREDAVGQAGAALVEGWTA